MKHQAELLSTERCEVAARRDGKTQPEPRLCMCQGSHVLFPCVLSHFMYLCVGFFGGELGGGGLRSQGEREKERI